ncbi:helix-turn-helix domain-containing protein [Streptomyces sp. SHP 1-2]|uniref:helix-turn-helix domain-containing protein n=1 Tax=Streptomyces sp. SHP 1-2 TaxID=2769489 RepID=UPI002237F81F|nr:helix-turn-helix transcriptional regulator [Streptomyces sp. SHP 1-2]MCW5252198.1 helix-turn-helix transcriptional regulator [Streptomyces sp. SHP 1-2]
MHHPPLPFDDVLARRRDIGTRIRATRLHANLTQEAVALRADIRIATYSRIENGHASPVLDTLIRIAHALDVPLSELVR